MKKIFKLGIFISLDILAIAGFFIWRSYVKTPNKPIGTVEIVSAPSDQSAPQNTTKNDSNAKAPALVRPAPLPSKVLISVPFTSQAPFGVWDAYHEEACEEASIIMVKYFLDKKHLTPEIADREILSVIDYEIKKLGHFKDSDAQEMVKIASDFYGIKNMKVIYDFQKDELKKYLAQGRPIIVPAAGRLLGNPNYTQPGPPYHALVLKGYDGDIIITNDPGTRRGESYEYDIDVIYGAIHDFPGSVDNITQGRKAMIVLD